jgi:hypothetical protein
MSATAVCPEPLKLTTTLGELLTRAHEDVHAYGFAKCPVCDGELMAQRAGAACESCGARLS